MAAKSCFLRKKEKRKKTKKQKLDFPQLNSSWLTALFNFHLPQLQLLRPLFLPCHLSVYPSIWLGDKQIHSPAHTGAQDSFTPSLTILLYPVVDHYRVADSRFSPSPMELIYATRDNLVTTVTSDWRCWRKSIHLLSFSRMIRKSRSRPSIGDALWKRNNSWPACVAIDRNCFPVEGVFAFGIRRLLHCHFVGCYYLIYSKSILWISLLFLSALLHFSNPAAFPWWGKSDENISLL